MRALDQLPWVGNYGWMKGGRAEEGLPFSRKGAPDPRS